MKKIKKPNHSALIGFSLFALLGFFVIYGSVLNKLFNRQVVLSGTSEKIYTPQNFVKTNSDPLITKAGDYFWSFVRNYTPVVGEGTPQVLFFCDFTDSSCRAIWQKLMSIKETTDLTLAWKNFPLAVSATSRRAAIAGLCASEQNKFLDYANLMFKSEDNLSSGVLRDLAKKAGLNLEDFNSCLGDEKMLQLVGQDLEDGQTLIIDQVPYLFIGNSRVESGQIDNLEKVIESER